MDNILLVAAERCELKGILRRCRHADRLDWPLDFCERAELNGQSLIMVANGPGPVLAAEAVRQACDRERLDAVLSTGLCGALDPALRLGDVFVASRIEAPQAALSYTAGMPRTQRGYQSGCLISIDRVVQTVEEKARWRATGAAAVEMEAAGVAAEARKADLPFFCVRVVMDQADESFALDLNSLRRPDGRFGRPRILRAALARPRVLLPELIRIERRSRLAARALGDFIADCRFQA